MTKDTIGDDSFKICPTCNRENRISLILLQKIMPILVLHISFFKNLVEGPEVRSASAIEERRTLN
jgi:hypothetical protein